MKGKCIYICVCVCVCVCVYKQMGFKSFFLKNSTTNLQFLIPRLTLTFNESFE